MHHAIVYHDPDGWAAVPANNGGSGSIWQWGDEILVGFTRGAFLKAAKGHQCDDERPFESWLARSRDGGESWTAWKPDSYAGDLNPATPRKAPGGLDFLRGGFVLRVEGGGYHGNEAARWFYSYDRAASWSGPFEFSGLLEHPELVGAQFTGRTAYIIGGRSNLQLFLTVRERSPQPELRVTLREKAFLARTQDGGASFSFVSWVVPRNDPYRAAMPAPVRLTDSRLVTALRRKSPERNWIDCFGSSDGGDSWSFLSTVGETESGSAHNGNPPALVQLRDGRLCCAYGNRSDRQIVARYSRDDGHSWGDSQVLRDGFQSVNGSPDLGYVRLFQRTDGRLVAVYFWCSPEMPETHVESTIFKRARLTSV